MLNKEGSFLLMVLILVAVFFFTSLPNGSGNTTLPPVDKKINRIVSLSPSNTEVLFALGADEQIVGVTTYCDYPKEALQKEKIGNFYNSDVEKIISLAPDLVVADYSLQQETIAHLQRAGLNVIAVKNETLAELLANIQLLAKVIDREQQGESLRNKLLNYCAEAEEKISKVTKKKRVFIEVWDHPLLTVGNKSYLNDLILQAGGINVAGDGNYDYYTNSLEDIYVKQPDVYLRLRGTDMGSKADTLPKELRELPAVKNGHVVTVFGDWIVRAGPRSFEALEELTNALYPELTKGVN